MDAPLRFSGRSSTRHTHGVALVIVLGFLVLLTVLIVAFFTSVTTEFGSTKIYTAGASTRFLTDASVNLVMGQINKATQGQQPGSPIRYTWASQPGMIRTYGDKEGTGSCYKLYSAASMVVGGNSKDVPAALEADLPAGWNNRPANFTDLNAPVTDAGGKLNFPILDGNLKQLQVNGADLLTYDSNDDGIADIEGFGISPATVPNYDPTLPVSSTNNPAPMPVQWLYLLKDGTLTAPDLPGAGGSSVRATWKSASDEAHIPTAANPIVGRVAFWTDDETCKLNINTAGEGTYYAMPHTNTKIDMNGTASFTTAPPLTREYTRYPGHPATTCLSVALGSWLGHPSLNASATYGFGRYFAPNAYTSTTDNSNYLGYTGTQPPTDPALSGKGLAAYMLLSPRNAIGGSFAGTANFVATATPTTPASVAVTNDSDRLYASVDELIFRYPKTDDADPRTDFPNAGLTKTVIEKQKFFLTASSRAPELTPFNTPKVSLWPQWYSANDRQKFQGPTQQLLAFCSSFGPPGVNSLSVSKKFEYFWEWYSSSIANTNGSLYSNTSSSSSSHDWTMVPRNPQLAKYLCNLGAQKVPGYGESFRSSSKYGDRCFSHIVLESLDYIRSSVARADYEYPASKTVGGVVSGETSQSTTEFIWIAPLMIADSILPGVSDTAPIKGFGWFPIFSEVVLGEGLQQATPPVRRPFLAFESFTAPWSFPAGQQNMYVTIKDLKNLGIVKLDGSPPPDKIERISVHRRVDAFGPKAYFYGRNLPIHTYIADLSGYKFTSSDSTGVKLGGTKPVQILLEDGFKRAFQTLNVTFSPIRIEGVPTSQTNIGDWYYSVDNLFKATGSLARGMECNAATAARGDYRILGGTVNAASDETVPAGTTGDLFAQNSKYNSKDKQAHSLWAYCRTGSQPIVTGASVNGANTPTSSIAGTLAPYSKGVPVLSSVDYGDQAAPLTPQGLQGAKNIRGRSGDWDTGTGVFPDGPYLNVVDQVDGNGSGYGGGNNNQMYFPSGAAWNGYSQTFSPNKRIASPVQFGSLPTGVSATPPRPWETLLFCPNPAARSLAPGADTTTETGHIGFQSPPDHMFLENFTIPVVEPYAISEPLSTAGKVNLNYQLAPFTYIDRSTALRGVMKSTLITAICGYDVKDKRYKSDLLSPNEVRYNINRDATLEGISKYYFNRGKLFMYPSEICDVFLVPQKIPDATYHNKAAKPPTSYDKMLEWWNPIATNVSDPLVTMCMTGDNLREEPYNRLYPRLTTKSNSYTVHYRVQMLQKSRGTKADEWVEGKDVVTAEHRGSSLIERYVDPNDTAFNAKWDSNTINVAFDASTTAQSSPDLSKYYKFRVISTKQFAP